MLYSGKKTVNDCAMYVYHELRSLDNESFEINQREY